MRRVEADEAVDIGDRLGGIILLVVGVDEIELHLVGVGAERVTRVQRFQQLDGIQVVACVQFETGFLVQNFRRFVGNLGFGAGTASDQRSDQGERHQQARLLSHQQHPVHFHEIGKVSVMLG